MEKVPGSGENHGDTRIVHGPDDVFVAHGATRLCNCSYACCYGCLYTVGKRKERITGEYRTG